jgi:hypothetical protein
MALSNISNTDTFYFATVVRMNQVLKIINDLTDYNLSATGTVTYTNPSRFQGNVTVNVASGMISGDGGLISNIRGSIVSSIPNSSLQNNVIRFTSSNTSLNIANASDGSGNTATLGGNTMRFTILTSSSVSDTSTSNIASASAVNTVHLLVVAANTLANLAYSYANTLNSTVVSISADLSTINVRSNAAFAAANTKLANTTGVVNGALIMTGITVTGNSGFGGTIDTASANLTSQTLSDTATISWNLAAGIVSTVTLGGNRTMAAPTNRKVGTYILHVVQDGAGSRTITWNSVFKWSAGVAPPLSTTAGARDIVTFICDGTNLYGSYLLDVR